MNNKFGTTKLLTVARAASVAAASVLGATIAVRFGDRSSGIAMVDASDPAKLLIFQITYADDGSHRASCLDFLAGGEDKEQIQRVFINRLVPEFVDRLPELATRARIVNYAQLVPKSAQLLFDLGESLEQILYHEGESLTNFGQVSKVCALVYSSEFASSITTVDRDSPEPTVTVKNATDSTHRILHEIRQSLGSLLADDLTENDSVDCQLALLLHNMSLTERSEAFQSAFAICLKPALDTYAALINSEFGQQSSIQTVFICDAIFSSRFCRDLLAASTPEHLAISFVRDPGLLGFLGALLTA